MKKKFLLGCLVLALFATGTLAGCGSEDTAEMIKNQSSSMMAEADAMLEKGKEALAVRNSVIQLCQPVLDKSSQMLDLIDVTKANTMDEVIKNYDKVEDMMEEANTLLTTAANLLEPFPAMADLRQNILNARDAIPEKRKSNSTEDLKDYYNGVRDFVGVFLKIKFTNDEAK